MPVTPLHLGPGIVLKAAIGKRLSLTVFSFSQVLMDAEVIGRLLLGAEQLHGFTNSITGATAVLLPAVLIGRPVCTWALTWWNRNLSPNDEWLRPVEPSISFEAAWAGAALGVYSHWALDALMHADAQPLWPFSSAKPFADWLSVNAIHTGCVAFLFLGISLLVIGRVTNRMRVRADPNVVKLAFFEL